MPSLVRNPSRGRHRRGRLRLGLEEDTSILVWIVPRIFPVHSGLDIIIIIGFLIEAFQEVNLPTLDSSLNVP